MKILFKSVENASTVIDAATLLNSLPLSHKPIEIKAICTFSADVIKLRGLVLAAKKPPKTKHTNKQTEAVLFLERTFLFLNF